MLIRKAIPQDCKLIAALLMLPTGEVIRRLIGEKNHAKAEEFLLNFIQQTANQYSFENCHVAELEGEITGVLLAYDGSKLVELRKPVLDYIQQQFGLIPTVTDETQAGEVYIDSIAVSPAHQGKGIGSKLLQHVIYQKKGETLGLLVDKTNPPAKRLYLRIGFESVGEKNLLGISLEHLQLKTPKQIL
jgi:ribosomal protein S18 acetylase RimI-like enzyme